MRRKANSEAKNSEPFAPREFYTVAQLADLLQLNEMTIYRIIKAGELRYHQIGRMMRFRDDDVEEFLKQRRVPARGRQAVK